MGEITERPEIEISSKLYIYVMVKIGQLGRSKLEDGSAILIKSIRIVWKPHFPSVLIGTVYICLVRKKSNFLVMRS